MDRRRARWTLLLVLGMLLAAATVTVFVTRPSRDVAQPPADQGLLPWVARGAFHTDDVLLTQAVAAWRTGVLMDGSSAPVPAGNTYVLWAGRIGAGRLFLLEGVGADGTPLVAQVAEHGDPASFGLDAVEELPADAPPALAVTYDGNLDLPGLSAGAGAALVQLLEAPTSETDQRALWRQTGRAESNELELLEMRDASMSETFLHLGGQDDPPTRVVVGSVGARAGILTTIDVRPDSLVPTPSDVALADGTTWGPSGRIDGREDVDARLAATEAYADAALVREVVAGAGNVDGVEISARLLEVDTDRGSAYLVLVARSADGQVACISSTGPLGPAPSTATPSTRARSTPAPSTPAPSTFADFNQAFPGGAPIALLRCSSPVSNVLVTVAAAPELAGPVRLSGLSAPADQASDRVVAVEPYLTTPRRAVVAALVNDPAVSVTLPALAEPVG